MPRKLLLSSLPSCCSLFVLSLSLAFAQPSKVLLRLRPPASSHALANLPIAICLRTDEYWLGVAASDAINILRRSGQTFAVLDGAAFSQPYYIVSKTPRVATGRLPLIGKPLLQDEHSTLLKITDTEAAVLAQQGWQIARLFEHPLPTKNERAAHYVTRAEAAATRQLIQQLNEEISDSSMTHYLARLEAFRTRYSFSDSIVAAREWLFKQFQDMGFSEVRFDPVPVFGSIQQNVVATKYGTINPNRVIVVGGHYDSILFDADPTRLAPGVDDDGTGTAGTLELARVLASADLEASIIFVPFAAEEQGLWGSSAFAEKAYTGGMSLALMLNMDMIGNVADQAMDMNVLTDNRSHGYAQLFARLATQHTNLIPVIGPSSGNSDHFPFQQYGFPALFIQEGDFSPNWHTSTDLLSNVNVPYATTVVKATLAMIVTVANSPEVPQGFTALELGDGHSQLLQWQGNREPDFAGYRLYLGKSSGMYDEPRTLTTTSDTLRNLVEGQPVYAALSAFDTQGNESLLTPEIIFTPRSAPLAPAGLAATSGKNDILLTWLASNREADLDGYTLTRVGPENAEQSFVFDATTTSFADGSVQPHVIYRYSLQARDRDGNFSAPSQVQRGQLVTHDRGILIVDGTKDGPNRPLQPPDEEVDGFYERIMQGYPLAGQWDLADSANQGLAMTDADLATYSTLVWHSDVNAPARRLASDTLALKKYLQNGGHLLLVGWGIGESLVGRSLVENYFAPGQFGHDYLQLEVTRTASGSDRDFKGADALLPDYPNVTIDPVKVPVFGGNLLAMEIVSALAPHAETQALYTYRSSAQPPSSYHGKPVGLKYVGQDFKAIVLDFPLYFLNETEAQALVRQALQDLGETATAIASPAANIPEHFALEQSYPNPVRLTVAQNKPVSEPMDIVIRYQTPVTAAVTLRIYNLLGQTVRTLVLATKPAVGHEVHWDGRSDAGAIVGAGIYFYEMRARNFRQVRKLVIVP